MSDSAQRRAPLERRRTYVVEVPARKPRASAKPKPPSTQPIEQPSPVQNAPPPVAGSTEAGEDALPPHIPENKEDLLRAIGLLGVRAKTERMKPKLVAELTGLLRGFPKQAQATRWKTHLKQLYQWEKENDQP